MTSPQVMESDSVGAAPSIEKIMWDKERLAARFLRTLLVFHEPGTVVEIRALNVKGRGGRPCTVSGYFADFERAAREAVDLDWQYQPSGIYFILNCINRGLLARSPNRMTDWPERTTRDSEITRRQWLLIDIDPDRPPGVSSTDEELDTTNVVAEEVRDWLMRQFGFYEPVHAISGNGVHLLFPIDQPNDPDVSKWMKHILVAVAQQFSGHNSLGNTLSVSIDTSVSSAAQLTKLYGTIARKGHYIEERPHRRSRLTYVPDYLELPQDSEGWYAP